MQLNNSELPELSVVIPALNEERTIGAVVDRVLSIPLRVQVIVVNDGSTDGTAEILRGYGSRIEVVTNPRPSGKGAALRKGFELVKGLAVIVQDADLEYAPEQIPSVVEPILKGEQTVVFGNRFHHGYARDMALPNKIVNVLLALSVRVLYGRRIHDEATCYKALRSDVLRSTELECTRFEFCPEVTAKVIRLGHRIAEVPISYEPRGKDAGKKIRWTDAPEAFWTLAKYRFWKPKAIKPVVPVTDASSVV